MDRGGIGTMSDTPLGSLSMQLRHICLEYPYAQLEAATSNFCEERRLGSGTAGTVYRGEMPDGSDVGVKVIDLASLGDDSMVAGFEEEIAVLSKFRHPNLVVLMGWARQDTRRFLIYEYMPGGDMFQRLVKSRNETVEYLWHERLATARGSSLGLAHLHNATPHAFHRDVKSANILLGGGSAKMADFGLSCVAKTRQAKDMMCKFPSGTPGYTCSTYIRTGKVTEGSEVYSFGMVMLELLINMMPAGMMNGELVYPISEAIRPSEPGAIDRCLEYADPLARWPQGVLDDFAQLALACIHPDDSQRPHFNEVCRSLKSIQERYPVAGGGYYGAGNYGAPHQNAYVPPVQEESFARGGTFGMPVSQQHPGHGPGSWGAFGGAATPGHGVGVFSHATPMAGFNSGGAPVLGRTPSRSASPPIEGADDESLSPPKRATASARAAAAAKAGVAGRTTPQLTVEAWPAGAEVVLEVAYVHGKDVASLPSHVRVPAFNPAVEEDGRKKTLQLGRHSQQQWFEAMLSDPVHRNSISRIACEICWGGADGGTAPKLRTLGSNLIVVDEKIVGKDHICPLSPGSQIRFMFQSDSELADLLMLVVHAVASPDTALAPSPETTRRGGYGVASPNIISVSSGSDQPESEPSNAKEQLWRMELIYASGMSPEAFMSMPMPTRTFSFAVSPSKPSVILGRQHQMAMFEALLQNQKELLAFVSRNHLQLELAAEGRLLVTNLSQNISIAGANILLCGSGITMASGDVISFAAQAEMVPGIDVTPIVTGDGVKRELAPFLTFRLVRLAVDGADARMGL